MNYERQLFLVKWELSYQHCEEEFFSTLKNGKRENRTESQKARRLTEKGKGGALLLHVCWGWGGCRALESKPGAAGHCIALPKFLSREREWEMFQNLLVPPPYYYKSWRFAFVVPLTECMNGRRWMQPNEGGAISEGSCFMISRILEMVTAPFRFWFLKIKPS